jgi:hypothetical protein
VKIGFVKRIARVWMSFRPGLPFPPFDSGVKASILVPDPLAFGLYG